MSEYKEQRMSIEQDVLERLWQLPPEQQREVLAAAESLQSRGNAMEYSLHQEFEALAEQWRDETMMLSSPTKAAMHPSYQRIIGMGQPAVPLILQELERRPDHWFWALHAITGEDPAHSADNVDAVTDAWLNWWRAR